MDSTREVLGPLCCHLTEKGHLGLGMLCPPWLGGGGWLFPRRGRQAGPPHRTHGFLDPVIRCSAWEAGPFPHEGAPTPVSTRSPWRLVRLLCLTLQPPETLRTSDARRLERKGGRSAFEAPVFMLPPSPAVLSLIPSKLQVSVSPKGVLQICKASIPARRSLKIVWTKCAPPGQMRLSHMQGLL